MATYSKSKWSQKCHKCQEQIPAHGHVFLDKTDAGWKVRCLDCYKKTDGYFQRVKVARNVEWHNPWAERWAAMASFSYGPDREAMRVEAMECELEPSIDCPWCDGQSYSRPSMMSHHFCAQGHHAEGRSAKVVGRDVETATNAVYENQAKYL